MKKLGRILLILVLCFIPTFVYAENEVKITSIELVEKTVETEIVEDATFDGLTINVNLKMKEVGDYAKYKVTIKNETDQDYELAPQESAEDAYIKYKYIYESEKKVIEKNTEAIVYVVVEYAKQVEDANFRGGVYQDNKVISINLSSKEENQLSNPKTGMKMLVFIIILLSLIAVLFLTNKWNKSSKVALMLAITLLLPATIYAVEQLNMTINSKIEIEEENELCYIYGLEAKFDSEGTESPTKFYEAEYETYKNGHTFRDRQLSHWNQLKDELSNEDYEYNISEEWVDTYLEGLSFISASDLECLDNPVEKGCGSNLGELKAYMEEHAEAVEKNSKIKSKTKGCYAFLEYELNEINMGLVINGAHRHH